ncbi:hypothetical protein JCM10212_002530 [Sporobolomyces blumeae]
MGVHGLWNLLSPVARPITPDSLRDKRLAVDASIWLYQFQMAIRDRKTGEAIKGNHIQGTYRRILKLLHWGIKPVFVFDGDAPLLKKRTIEKRRRRKEGAGRDFAKTAQQLLSAQLRNHAAENALSRRRNADIGGTGGAMDTGEVIDESAVYLEDLEAGKAPVPYPATTPSPVKKARKEAMRDEYALPAINGGIESRVKMSDPRIATEEELRDFIEDLRPEDLDINSDFFGNLPTEVKYEILGDLRIKTRQVNHRRVQQMRGSATAIDFSRAQIDNLMERNHYTQKLLAVTDELGTSAIAIPTRVAGSRNREYLLVKQDASKGGGWVLGVKNPEITSTEPITIDTTTDESVGGHTDEDEFEEVGIDKGGSPSKNHLPTPDVEARRLLAVEAVRARVAPPSAKPVADPYLDVPQQSTSVPSHLFLDGADDLELQEALFESMDANRDSRQSKGPAPSAISITIPRPPPPAIDSQTAGQESDDSMEYVEVDPVPRPPRIPLSQAHPTPVVTIGDTDDSDNFDEVDVAEPVPPTATAVPLSAPRASSGPASRGPSPHQSPAVPQTRTLFDAVLPSDSESENEAPRPSSPAPRVSVVRPDEPAPDDSQVTARDFAEQEDFGIGPARPAGPRSPVKPQVMTPAYRSCSEVAVEASVPPAEPESSIAAAPQPSDPSTMAEDPRRMPKVASDAPASRLSPVERTLGFSPAPPNIEKELKEPEMPADEPAKPAIAAPSQALSPSLPLQLESPEATPVPTPRRMSPPTLFRRSESVAAPNQVEENRAGELEHGADGDEDDEGALPWSRSPTPPANRKRRSEPAPPQDLIDAAIAEASKGMQSEQEEYAAIARSLQNEDLETMQTDARRDMARLLEQRNAEQRNADGITRQMANEIKEMLILFGIPFLDAPQEAEAECASLLSRSLVDGVVTDDSDVFLFGASRVYRNMFEGNKYLECYLMSDFERELNLTRDKLVRLAYLLGGDYDDGLPGVGPVLARELVDEFDGDDALERFKVWWKAVEAGKDTKQETNTPWKRKFKKGHKSLVIEGNWPKPEIARAYYHPVVHESDEPFSWGGIDLDGLLMFLTRTMGWSQEYCMKDLKPLLDRLKAIKEGKEAHQKSLPDFFDPSAGHDHFRRRKPVKYASERLQSVIRNWKNQQATVEEVAEGVEEGEGAEAEAEAQEAESASKKRKGGASTGKTTRGKKTTGSKAPKRRGSSGASRKKTAEPGANGYSSEEDEQGASTSTPPLRQQATRPARRKAVRTPVVSDLEE